MQLLLLILCLFIPDERFDIIHDAADTVEAEIAAQLDALEGVLEDCMMLCDTRAALIAALELQIANHACATPEPGRIDLHTLGFQTDLTSAGKAACAELGIDPIPFLADGHIYGPASAPRPTHAGLSRPAPPTASASA
jgi:hypothetical protein